MRWQHTLALPLYASSIVLGVCAHEQVPLAPIPDSGYESQHLRPWDERPSKDATGNLIFQSLASLLQLAPNSKYVNGHAIIRASIPPGTLLYHGHHTTEPPTRDWIAFDPEHSHIFTGGLNATLFTYSATREINLLFFDGASGNKFGGAVDTQDVLFWGEVNYDPHDKWFGEMARFHRMCEWGKQYGLDGIVRMQIDFELMYCNISDGLELVSAHSLVANDGVKSPLDTRDSVTAAYSSAHMAPEPTKLPPIHREPMVPPDGWKGSLPSTFAEVRHTGTWHNSGEVRIRVDPSTMVSFYDPALTSVVESRRSSKRPEYRLTGISKEDVARVQADVTEMLARDPTENSGVDWQSLARVIQDRFFDRLPFVRHLLHQPYSNASEHVLAVRRQLLVSLLPYMHREHVGTPEWYAQMAEECATQYTARLPLSKFTKQEHVLYNATKEVLHEICRVYTKTWRGAFDIEDQSVEVVSRLLVEWRGEFDALIKWLDWPAWMKCDPACGVDEFCFWPQGAVWESDSDRQPQCLPMNKDTL
ncbi:uncharacterized protein B0H18DRAFT_1034860 [Fomitopsis serialis]|uniref:uncharacterized protein n=1 Tax=Fomitopsis serialis TaxID=139415 RepID=UPI0020082892|nr:uncharacterized protein B0H18DRAFT_1034860 [Neoantrodia serialis]KAH9917311.1 hypothetical protein B0H18DRAFT_1034860 [Neoantrodia serialis]